MHHYDQIVSSDAARHLTIVVEVERSCFDEASVSLELANFAAAQEQLSACAVPIITRAQLGLRALAEQ